MGEGRHSRQTVSDGIHIIHAWEVADATARGALSVVATDVGKVAKQVSPLSWWLLTNHSPATWVQIDGGGGGSVSHNDLTDVTSDQHHAQLHGSSHHNGGGDAVKLDDLATPDDNTDLDASTTRHGLLRKLDNDGDHYLDGEGNWTTPAGGGSVFGQDYQYAEDLTESSTTSDDWSAVKLQMVVPARTGTYRVNWVATIWQSNVNDSAEARLRNVTDGESINEVSHELNNSTDRLHVGGFDQVVFTGATKTFEIQFRQTRGSTCYIMDARIEFWRVA